MAKQLAIVDPTGLPPGSQPSAVPLLGGHRLYYVTLEKVDNGAHLFYWVGIK